MKQRPKSALRHLAAFYALLLLLTASTAPAAAAQDIYFTSVNDKLLDLTAETMPEVVGGILYVPYTVFDGNYTGVNFGIYFSGNKLQNTVVMYSRQKTLIFDLSANNSYDSAQNVYRFMAVTRNNRIYLPASFVCDFFGLTYSYLITDIAPLIRITNEDRVLTDSFFANAAASLMQSRYSAYLNGLTPSQPQTPPPDIGGGGVVSPPTNPQTEEKVPFHLSFLCSGGAQTEKILAALDSRGVYGLFLFSPDDLAGNDDLIRRILGSGHSIGFAVPNAKEDTLSLLEEGNRLLRLIARSSTRLVSIPGLTEEDRAQLEQAGWTSWKHTVNGVYKTGSFTQVSAKIISQLEKEKDAIFLQMDDGEISAGALPRILRHLENGNYYGCKVFETMFLCG